LPVFCFPNENAGESGWFLGHPPFAAPLAWPRDDADQESRQQQYKVGPRPCRGLPIAQCEQTIAMNNGARRPPAVTGSITTDNNGMPIIENPPPNAPFMKQSPWPELVYKLPPKSWSNTAQAAQ
jgi:hypothetical protein